MQESNGRTTSIYSTKSISKEDVLLAIDSCQLASARSPRCTVRICSISKVAAAAEDTEEVEEVEDVKDDVEDVEEDVVEDVVV